MMNSRSLIYYDDSDFAISVMKQCSLLKTGAFFQQYGLMITEDHEGRKINHAASLLAILKKGY